MKFGIIFIVIMLFSTTSFAGGQGKIIGINFSGPGDSSHPNIVQFKIEGGFNTTGCDTNFAAIRVTDENQHLISFALAAFVTKEPVIPVLVSGDKYFASRCTVSRLSSVY